MKLQKILMEIVNNTFTNYTGVVQDLLDGKTGYDQVSGYTIRQIEQSLKGSKSWNQWRDRMKSEHINSTENRINELFNNWH